MGATHFLPKVAGNETALYLLTTGDIISGNKARNLGLASHIGRDSESTIQNALNIADKIGKQSPTAVKQVVESLRVKEKKQASESQGLDLRSDLERESDCQSENFGSSEMEEGLKAVVEKRRPDFFGKKKEGGGGGAGAKL